MTDTIRSWEYLLSTLVPGNTEPAGQTTLLAQAARDLITTVRATGITPEGYDFSAFVFVVSAGAADPGRRLTAGVTNTVRFVPVPPGVNGTDTQHYLEILDAAGVSEPVLITGGTAVAGAPSGTVTFVPAHNHSGDTWVLASGSGGITEAIGANPTSIIRLSARVYNMFAPVLIPLSCPAIIGAGVGQTYIDLYYLSGDAFTGVGGAALQYLMLMGFMVRGQVAEMTSGAVFSSSGDGQFTFRELASYNTYNGISLSSIGNCRIEVSDSVFYFVNRGIDIMSFFNVKNVKCLTLRDQHTYLPGSAALYIHRGVGGSIEGFSHDAGVCDYGLVLDTSSSANEIEINNLYLDNWKTKGLTITGGGLASYHIQLSNFQIYDNNAISWGITEPNAVGITLSSTSNDWQAGNGTISHGAGVGIIIQGAKNVLFSDLAVFPATDGVITPGAAVQIDNIGTPANLNFNGQFGRGFFQAIKSSYGIRNLSPVLVGLGVNGMVDAISQANKVSLLGTEQDVSLMGLRGIGNVAKSVVAAATLAFPVLEDRDVLSVTGSTNITAVSGLREGQTGILICTGTPAWTNGATIGSPTVTLVANTPGKFAFTGGKLYVSI